MTFRLDDHWVWDYWLADDGATFHLYALRAPKSLGDPELRHRNARIGHAMSNDLREWVDLGEILSPGGPSDFDANSTWTGSIVRDHDGLWWMFYTGARWDGAGNSQAIGMATSPDLHTWTKTEGVVIEADTRWYEKRGESSWTDEAWRDPWVFYDESLGLWRMLITARANFGADDSRGVVGHAVSTDLLNWEVGAPLSEPDNGFAHLEVLQSTEVDGRAVLLFSCDTLALSHERREVGETGGIWSLPLELDRPPIAITEARLLSPQSRYSGRLTVDRSGHTVMLAFEATGSDGEFQGRICDPIRVDWSADGSRLQVHE